MKRSTLIPRLLLCACAVLPIIASAGPLDRQDLGQPSNPAANDMLRVPGTETDLLTVKSRGADVRIVYSPMDALAIARENPGRRVVFFAVGVETTAPANDMAV